MNHTTEARNSLISDIWASFQALPTWVKIWMMLILVPINFASLFFLSEPTGGWVALLAIGAMIPNLPIMWQIRGFSKAMAPPHVVPWTILVGWLLFARPQASGVYATYLWVLLIVNSVSLLFDYTDSWQWLKGNRAVVGRLS